MQICHNTVAAMCRIALRALNKPLNDHAIYRFAQGYSGSWNDMSTLEESIMEWAQSEELDRMIYAYARQVR